MNLKCWFSGHKWGPWEEVKHHLEKECLRCPKVLAKYPDPLELFIKGSLWIINKYLHHRYNIPLKGKVIYQH